MEVTEAINAIGQQVQLYIGLHDQKSLQNSVTTLRDAGWAAKINNKSTK